MRASVLFCAVLFGCGSPADPSDAGHDGVSDGAVPDGAVPSRARVVASEGGEVQSPDGVFTLVVPPDALAEDTDFAITIVPRDEWPAEAETLAPLGEIYDIQPDGVTFLVPALGIHALATTPSVLREDGHYAAVEHVMRSESALESAPSTEITYGIDGDVRVEAELPHTSQHWATVDLTRQEQPCSPSGLCDSGATCVLGNCIRPLTIKLGLVGEAGEHEVGDIWGVSSMEIYASRTYEADEVQIQSYVSVPSVVEHDVPADWMRVGNHMFAPARRGIVIEPGVGHALAPPLPGWRCAVPGSARLTAGAFIRGERDIGGAPVSTSVRVVLGDATCTDSSAPAPLHDHMIVGSTCRVVSGSIACDPATSGSTVSIQALSAEESARCTELAPGTELCEGVTGKSAPGPNIAITTSIADINATYDASAQIYSVDWPTTLEAIPNNEPSGVYTTFRPLEVPEATPIELPAPAPIESVEEILSEIEGVSSVVAPRAGETLDRLAIAYMFGGDGSSARLYRRLPGDASVPILDGATIAALSTRALTVDRVLVGPIAETTDTTLFGTPILVAAGRFIEADPIDLFPTPPSPVHDCAGGLPADLDALAGHPGENAVLCIGADGSCFVTNDVRIDTPLLPSQCPSSDRALIVLIGTGATTANAGGEWLLPWASYGTDALARGSNPPELTDVSTIVQRSDGARWRIDYRIVDGDTVHVESVTPVTVVPPYGVAFDGLDTPQTFTSSYEVGTAQVFVRACFEPSGIFLHGNTMTTTEVEQCRNSFGFALALLVDGDGVPSLDADHPGTADQWQVTSTSHGTMAAADWVTGLPTDVDVTTRVSAIPGGFPLEIVYRYTGSGFIVQSVTPL